jgi:hypothetical protein
MLIQRRKFGILAASSLLAGGLPFSAFADPDDKVSHDDKGEGHRELHIHSEKHKAGATTAQFLQHDWNIDFHSDKVAEDDWKYDFPEHGQASALIDYKGNWQFSGSFPSQPLHQHVRLTVGIGLKTSLGKIFGLRKTLTIFHDGGQWSKQGNDAVVGDLWKDVTKGHEWAWSAHFRQVPPNEPPAREESNGGGGGGGESTADQVGDDIAKSLLGPVGFFL